jgi:hypothetical protein
MRYRSCDFFGSPEEVQVDRHASRLVEGEGGPTFSPPCRPPRPDQPRRLLHQNPPCISPPSRPSLPPRHPLSPYHPQPPHTYTHPNPAATHPPHARSSRRDSSTRQGPTFSFVTLDFTSKLAFTLSLAFHFTICFSSCILNRGPNAPAHRSPTNARGFTIYCLVLPLPSLSA